MRKKILLGQILILIIASVLMLGSVTYAWFSKFEKTSIIEIDTASLKVEADLYFANTNPNNEYILITDSLNIENVVPGDKFHFMLKVKNSGSINGDLNVSTSSIQSTNINIFKFIINDEQFDIDENSNVLFESIEISDGETKELYFQILVTGNLNNTTAASLFIESFKIRIDQKR